MENVVGREESPTQIITIKADCHSAVGGNGEDIKSLWAGKGSYSVTQLDRFLIIDKKLESAMLNGDVENITRSKHLFFLNQGNWACQQSENFLQRKEGLFQTFLLILVITLLQEGFKCCENESSYLFIHLLNQFLSLPFFPLRGAQGGNNINFIQLKQINTRLITKHTII